jgi:hypothetical protein
MPKTRTRGYFGSISGPCPSNSTTFTNSVLATVRYLIGQDILIYVNANHRCGERRLAHRPYGTERASVAGAGRYPAAKAQIPVRTHVRHGFVNASTWINKWAKTAISRRWNASDVCVFPLS